MSRLVGLLGLAACQPRFLAPHAPDASVSRAAEVTAAIAAWNADLAVADRDAKYCAMAVAPFPFFRGTAHLFWSDWAHDPRLLDYGGFRSWVSGDAHAQNFGAFDNDRGDIVYEVNDFDEAVIADPQLDLWRLATSVVLLAEANGLHEDDQAKAVDAATEAWLDTLAAAVGNDDETDAAITEDSAYGLLDDFLEDLDGDRDREQLIREWTDSTAGVRHFDLDLDELDIVSEEARAALLEAFPGYLTTLSGRLDADPDYFEVVDIARRLDAGTGSLGAPRYYVLIAGASGSWKGHRILDVKRQGLPAAAAAGATAPLLDNAAERVVLGHKALGVRVDDHLGWLLLDDGAYTVRERSPFKATFDSEDLDTRVRLEKLSAQWGTLLAYGHARSDDDHDAELFETSLEEAVDAATDGDHSGYRRLVREVAVPYAEMAADDHAAFVDWLDELGVHCP